MGKHEKIDYVEFASHDLAASKQFFSHVFGWEFQDYGPDYSAFSNAGIAGGFYRSAQESSTTDESPARQNVPLVVLYSDQLEQTQAKIEAAGGHICKPVFAFPGGRRFHFTEPGGNELAVWSDKDI